eukprot:1192026-Prorocentrum_minimum.AAC.1
MAVITTQVRNSQHALPPTKCCKTHLHLHYAHHTVCSQPLALVRLKRAYFDELFPLHLSR